jgi:hypothetical protein
MPSSGHLTFLGLSLGLGIHCEGLEDGLQHTAGCFRAGSNDSLENVEREFITKAGFLLELQDINTKAVGRSSRLNLLLEDVQKTIVEL